MRAARPKVVHGAKIDGHIAVAGLCVFCDKVPQTKVTNERSIRIRSCLFNLRIIGNLLGFADIKMSLCKSVYVNCRRVFIRGSRRLPVLPEGLVCATKLH